MLVIMMMMMRRRMIMIIIMMNCFAKWLTDKRRCTLFSARTMVDGSYHQKPPTHQEKDLNQSKTCVQTLSNEVV